MKVKSTHSVQPKKAKHMSDETFANLKESLEEALAFERGEERKLHVTRIRSPHPPKSSFTQGSPLTSEPEPMA
jgi:hypothetical protein